MIPIKTEKHSQIKSIYGDLKDMSAENASQMINALQQDEALRSQIESEASSSEAALNLTVELGKEQGLDFTAEEFRSELEARGLSVNTDGQLESLSASLGEEGELSEDALEAVAGGFYYGSGRNCSQW
ncbi:MAG: Nif11-like leader peptide family natural product precursor [Cuspidothrix sp.]